MAFIVAKTVMSRKVLYFIYVLIYFLVYFVQQSAALHREQIWACLRQSRGRPIDVDFFVWRFGAVDWRSRLRHELIQIAKAILTAWHSGCRLECDDPGWAVAWIWFLMS